MTQFLFRFFLAEGCAVLGVGFGAWLIHHAFQPASDTPNPVLLLLGGLDILICGVLLSYLLRLRLQDGERLPKSWIVAGAILLAAYLGWITALLRDAERLRVEQRLHHEADRHLMAMEEAVRQFQQILPAAGGLVDRKRWELSHDRYAREYDQLHAQLRGRLIWEQELTRINDQVQQLHQLVSTAHSESRLEPRSDGQLTRERAQQQIEKFRSEIANTQQELDELHRIRWHAIGSTALTGVFLLLGCMLPWLVFDRELRRRHKAQSRLAVLEGRFRSLVERQPEAVAVLDASAQILYANAAWETAFNYRLEDLQGRPLLELIHPDHRARVQVALQEQNPQIIVPCRLSADYGIWHDVELQCQQHDGEQTSAVRIRNLRESPEIPVAPSILKLGDSAQLREATEKRAEMEKQLQRLAESERQARADLQTARKQHEEDKKAYEARLDEVEHHRTHLEKSLRDREAIFARLEADLHEREAS